MSVHLIVTYEKMPEFPSASRFDERLEALIGKICSGSGFGSGERDISWNFKTVQDAESAARKIRNYIRRETDPAYRSANVRVM